MIIIHVHNQLLSESLTHSFAVTRSFFTAIFFLYIMTSCVLPTSLFLAGHTPIHTLTIHIFHSNSGIFYLRSLNFVFQQFHLGIFLECSPESLSLLFQQSETCTSRFCCCCCYWCCYNANICLHFALHFRNWFLYDVNCIVFCVECHCSFFRRAIL